MAVNPKQKRELSDMWDKSKEAGGSSVPDGTYRFKVVKAVFEMGGKPCFKTQLEVVGGDESMVGETIEQRDNLETAENMGWFKSKLARLNMADVSFDDIEDGTLAEQLKGKTFEGQAKTKGGFLNVYVNRLISEGADDAEEETPKAKGKAAKEETEEEEKEETSETGLSEGDAVTWSGKTGEVVEILEDEGLARVKKEDGSIVRVKLESLEKAEDASEEEAEEEEKEEKSKKKGEESEEEFTLPEADDVDDLTAKEVKEALGNLGFEASDVRNPRGVLHAFCALGNDPDAKIDLSEVAPLADALEIELKKGQPFKESLKVLSKAVSKKLG
jgi:hypothetical protein